MNHKLGIDHLLENSTSKFKKARIGLLAHPASVNKDFIPTLELLHQHPDFNLTQLFGPEHGITGIAQDMESVSHDLDPLTKLPVKSLYGSSLSSIKPHPDDFNNIDVLICDLQDIGARYYTYIYTMAFCLELASLKKIKVIVLDRPNPINGNQIEGNLLDRKFSSFVGYYPLLTRHGMTIGEIAQLLNQQEGFHADLEIIPLSGWNRKLFFDQTDFPWIAPSPNMPTIETAILYPGMCLFEATEISEARGTTKPFEWIGAPYIDAFELAKKMNQINLAGVHFRPIAFKPGFQKYHNQICQGVQIHITDRNSIQSLSVGMYLLKTIHDLYPENFQWREKPYEFVDQIPAIDLLWGNDQLRKCLENHQSIENLINATEKDQTEFKNYRNQFLIYE